LLVSDSILAEVDDVSARSEVLRKLRVTPREARAILVRVRRRATLIHPDVTIRMSRDPSDDKFLECAVSGEADYVVSADADLLSLGDVRGIPILDVPTFWQKLSEQQSR
jgi:putative PIN family toxin of toxin-antitoxin system